MVINAGIGSAGALLDMDPASYDRVIEVKLLGSVRTVRAFLPALIESHGHVLQIASLAAMVHALLMSAYAASKAGVEAFAHPLRPEVAAADADPVLKALRAGMPGPFGRTYPLVSAVTRLVVGSERRSPHVFAQRWLRAMMAVRGAAPSLVARSTSGPAAAAQMQS